MPAKRAPHTITHSQRPFDVAVLGGGVAGLAVAWRARARGLSVCVLDRGELGAATSRVAAGAVQGLELRGGERMAAGRVVVAAGPWSGGELGLPADARVPVRPVKGQTVRLRDPGGPGLLVRVVRFDGGYLVPRADGRMVLGATVEERGFDPSVTAWAVHELLRDAAELVPGVLELEVEELLAGLRPGTPDNAPILGASGVLDGLVWATGHHRNGILLAPVTAQLVTAELAGEPAGHPFGPGRFVRTAAVAP